MEEFGEGSGTPLQYSCLENPMDRGAWWAAVHGVAKSRTQLSDFTFTFHYHALEKEMATHSSVLAWRTPGTGGLPSLGSHRVGHDWSNLAAAAAAENFKEMRKGHNFRSYLEVALDRILLHLWQDFGLDLSSAYYNSFFKKVERENDQAVSQSIWQQIIKNLRAS